VPSIDHAIDLAGVSFAHSDSVSLISDVDLELRAGWTGVVGANGAGKTTLLGLIAGRLSPDAGRIHCHPAALLSPGNLCECPQRVEQLSPRIDAFARDNGRVACRLRGQLELEPDEIARWTSLSPGERKRWQIGAALSLDPAVLLLDEPTNHLDSAARELLLRSIAAFDGIGVVVSHDRSILNQLCKRTLRMAHGRVTLYRGGYDTARATWEAERREEHARHQRIRREQKKLTKRLAERRSQRDHAEARTRTSKRMKGPRDNAARGAFKQTRRRSAVNALGREIEVVRHSLDRLERRAAGFVYEKELGRSLFVGFSPPKRSVLFQLDAGTLSARERVLFETPSLQFGPGDRVRLCGLNGCGKTTLIDRLWSTARFPRERCLFLPQEIDVEQGRLLLDSARALDPDTRGRLMHLVAALGVDPEALLLSHRASPGETRKLALACGLARQVWALVVDEPTNHLDLPSIERLEACLADYPGALLLVSHDDAFAQRLTDTCWEISGGRLQIGRDGAAPRPDPASATPAD